MSLWSTVPGLHGFTFIFTDKGKIRVVNIKAILSVMAFLFYCFADLCFKQLSLHPLSLSSLSPLPFLSLSIYLLSALWVPQLVDRCEMPAVRVTDAVSPLCSHVTGATSRQHVHRRTHDRKARVCVCVGWGGGGVFVLLHLRGQGSVCVKFFFKKKSRLGLNESQ